MLQHHKYRKNKGQIAAIDFFISLLIFSVLLTITMLRWSSYHSKISERMEYHDMMTKAFQISDALVKSPGVPSNWDSSNVKIIGLAAEDRKLSIDKVNAFTNLSLNKTKSILQIYGYKFYFNLTKINGEAIKQYGEKSDGKKSVNVRRYLLYGNEKAIMQFEVLK